MVVKETNKIRLGRRSKTCEVFTPDDLCNIMLDKLPADVFTDFSKTILEPCAGNGNFVIAIIRKRLQYCKNDNDIKNALSTIYSVELMQDNLDEMKTRIKDLIGNSAYKLCESTINHNMICSDFFNWDFENWRPVKEYKGKELF